MGIIISNNLSLLPTKIPISFHLVQRTLSQTKGYHLHCPNITCFFLPLTRGRPGAWETDFVNFIINGNFCNFIRRVFFVLTRLPSAGKKLLKMSVATTNVWYHAEWRIMSKHQWRSGRVQRWWPWCRRFESFGQNFLIIIIFFFTLYNEKNCFCNKKHF
jgi:hypothetical protein